MLQTGPLARVTLPFAFVFALVFCPASVAWADDDDPPADRTAKDAGSPETPAEATPEKRPPPKAAVPPPPPRTPPAPPARSLEGEAFYDLLSKATRDPKSILASQLLALAIRPPPPTTQPLSFRGNLRLFRLSSPDKTGFRAVFLLREETGKLHLLALPKDPALLEKKAASPYADLKGMIRSKMIFTGKTFHAENAGLRLSVFLLAEPPKRQVLDRLFFLGITLLLFLTMVGMGMTLTREDFARIAQKPRGMIIGPLCQFGLLPLLAFGIGHLFGFPSQYPFIFAGLILVAASPGGVTSNLMTYFAKGDVALSISLTAFSTILSVFMTPFLLALYASSIPTISIPLFDVISQIFVLVILPLFIGMLLRSRAEGFALKSEKFFAALGLLSLIFLIVVGILTSLDKFADTARYGVRFYSSIFLLTFAGMVFGGVISRLVGVDNSQARAISLETGLQNASLAMTLALLLQDRMGDFYSSMFFTSGIFGLWMYVASAIVLFLFHKGLWLPIHAPQK